jgi:hypothetical protein
MVEKSIKDGCMTQEQADKIQSSDFPLAQALEDGMISQEEYELRQARLLVIPEPRWFPKCEEIM